MKWLVQVTIATFLSLLTASFALAADYPEPKQAIWTAKDFKFHTGETLPEVHIGYTTIGDPRGEPVLLMHGSGSTAAYFLTRQYGQELFGLGQPLDATKYFLVLPDAIGSGRTSKPSDGLRSKYPKYNYADMVQANYRLLTEGLGVKHLRLVSGNSMGGMEAWCFATMYPDFMDGVVALSSTPARMSGRNWLTRRLLIETIRSDPSFNSGEYVEQPKSMKFAFAWFAITTNGGAHSLLAQAPDAAAGDRMVSAALNASERGDANDLIYQYEAAADFDPWSSLKKITAPVLSINSEDDERNPPELGVMERASQENPLIKYVLIKASPETRGHSTVGNARFWKADLADFLSNLPRR